MKSKLHRTVVVVLAIYFVIARYCAAQAPTIDGRLLPTGVDTFSVSFGGSVIGRGIMARSRVRVGNRREVLQVYHWNPVHGEASVDSLFVDATSLHSIRELRVVADTVTETTFASDSVLVEMRLRRGTVVRRSSAPGKSVYSSAILDGIVSASPLANGFHAEPTFLLAAPLTRGVVPISVRVVSSERVPDHAGTYREAWVVSAATPSGETVFWIEKSSRIVLKYDTHEGAALIEFRR